MSEWVMLKPAIRLVEHLKGAFSGKLNPEILKLDNNSSAIIIDMDGVDYILTMQIVPKQRARPTNN